MILIFRSGCSAFGGSASLPAPRVALPSVVQLRFPRSRALQAHRCGRPVGLAGLRPVLRHQASEVTA